MAIDLTQYKNIDFANFLSQQGYSDKTSWARSKRSQNYLAFENQAYNDRVIVKKNINSFADVDSGKGYRDIIQFVTDRLENVFSQYKTEPSDFYSAIKFLDHYLSSPVIKHQFIAKDNEKRISKFNLNDFIVSDTLPKANYLHSIGLDDNIIKHELFTNKILLVRNPVYENGTIKKHTYGNISFPYIKDWKDNVVIGFEQRNINYKGHSINSDRKNGVWLSNKLETTTHLLITESAKDALGHFAKYKSLEVMYCSVGGNLSKEQISTINKVAKELNVIKVLGFDNDLAGSTFTLQYIINELNPLNTVHAYKSAGKEEVHLKLISTALLNKQLNEFFQLTNQSRDALIKPISINDGILNIAIKADQECISKLTYHILKANAQLFKGNYLIQRPIDKDFFDTYLMDKKTQNQGIQPSI